MTVPLRSWHVAAEKPCGRSAVFAGVVVVHLHVVAEGGAACVGPHPLAVPGKGRDGGEFDERKVAPRPLPKAMDKHWRVWANQPWE